MKLPKAEVDEVVGYNGNYYVIKSVNWIDNPKKYGSQAKPGFFYRLKSVDEYRDEDMVAESKIKRTGIMRV